MKRKWVMVLSSVTNDACNIFCCSFGDRYIVWKQKGERISSKDGSFPTLTYASMLVIFNLYCVGKIHSSISDLPLLPHGLGSGEVKRFLNRHPAYQDISVLVIDRVHSSFERATRDQLYCEALEKHLLLRTVCMVRDVEHVYATNEKKWKTGTFLPDINRSMGSFSYAYHSLNFALYITLEQFILSHEWSAY